MHHEKARAPLVALHNISFTALNTAIVKRFSYQFFEGTVSAITGGAGSGKSTVLKLAAGLLVPHEGSAFYRGRDIAAMNKKENLNFRRESGFVFQDSALWANQSIYQILELPLRVHFPAMTETMRKKKIAAALAGLGWTKEWDLRPDRLSMGEQKLIAFTRAVICDPKLLFLDEWTESLDELSVEKLFNMVQRYKAEGRTIIFVSHDPVITKSLADFVLIVNNGVLEENNAF
ncbi:MAG: ATP-binding cassette domain-containing protein [Spirochaetaceae bacterium]|nr:ATP-binding cassette domain-containing protein [Spirochaetaceae bacterium]